MSPTYEWSIGSETYTGSTLNLDPSMVLGDTVICTVSAADSAGGSDSDSASVNISNINPVILSVSIAPATDVTIFSTPVFIQRIDSDGDSRRELCGPIYRRSDLFQHNMSFNPESVDTAPTDSIQCSVTVDDGNGGSDTASTNVSIQNTPPLYKPGDHSCTQRDDRWRCVDLLSDRNRSGRWEPTSSYQWEGSNGALIGMVEPDLKCE